MVLSIRAFKEAYDGTGYGYPMVMHGAIYTGLQEAYDGTGYGYPMVMHGAIYTGF